MKAASLNRAALMFTALLAAACLPGLSAAADGPGASDDALRARVNAFVDAWHDDAAHARFAYFDKIAADGIYIGTDRTERWTRDEFLAWGRRFFARESAWSFTPLNRHIGFNADRSVIWFDEQLESAMGVLQASGVMRSTTGGFEIVHYQLSIAVPNDVQPQVTDAIKAFESR